MAEKKKKLAAILVRGREVGLNADQKATLDTLRLLRKHACAIIEDTPVNRGLLNAVKDFITYGPISDETLKDLKGKRASLKSGDRELNVFRLHPPRGGWERKGIKVSYQNGGALGLRRGKMDDLIMKMV